MRLRFSVNRSQMTSKCGLTKKQTSFPGISLFYPRGKREIEGERGREREGETEREREGETWKRCCTKGAHKPQAIASLIFLPHVEVFCVLLLRGSMETWNLFVSYNEQKEKTDKLVS